MFHTTNTAFYKWFKGDTNIVDGIGAYGGVVDNPIEVIV